MNRTLASSIAVLLLAGCLGAGGQGHLPPLDPAAQQVPVLSPAPQLDQRALWGEWDAALTMTGTFAIHDGTPAAGDYPFEVHLGHDAKWLFAYAVVHGLPNPNPYDGTTAADHSDRHSFALEMFLDSRLAAALTRPEDWKVFNGFLKGGSGTADGYWNNTEWALQNEGGDPQAKPWDGNRPTSGTWGRGFTAGSNDLAWEIYIPLKSTNKAHDGFQVGPKGEFRLGLQFDVGGGTGPDGFVPHDGWPGDGYT